MKTEIDPTRGLKNIDKRELFKKLKNNSKDKTRPLTPWPRTFVMSVKSKDESTNFREDLYVDISEKKIRTSTFYSILGLEEQHAFDIYLDDMEDKMAVVSADECITHYFKPALSGLELFF